MQKKVGLESGVRLRSLISVRKSFDPPEPFAKMPSGCSLRQGTTSVVPQMANLDSGFIRCGIANC
jgi:hypothetical protein